MKNTSLGLTVVAAGALLFGTSALAQTNEPMSEKPSASASSQSSASTTTQSGRHRHATSSSSTSTEKMSDQDFAKKAAEGSMAEIKFAQLAQQKSDDKSVKDFAQRIVDDHTDALNKVKSIAQNKNITLPDSLNSKDQAEYDRLSKLSGDQFDRAYLRFMERDHRKDIAEFQREANNGKDSDLKQYAQNTLPKLQEHLQMAASNLKMERNEKSATSSSTTRRHRGTSTDNTGNPPNTDNSSQSGTQKKY